MTNIEDLLDIHEIENLRILYSAYFDGREIDNLMELFSDDAVC